MGAIAGLPWHVHPRDRRTPGGQRDHDSAAAESAVRGGPGPEEEGHAQEGEEEELAPKIAEQILLIERQARQISSDFKIQENYRFFYLYTRTKGESGRPIGIYAGMSYRDWIATYCHILDQDGTLQMVVPNHAQRRFFDTVDWFNRLGLPIRIVILKARQTGFSTIVQLYLLERALREKYLQAQLIANREDTAKKVLNIAARALRHLPKSSTVTWDLCKTADSRTEILFGEPLFSRIDIDTAEAQEPGHGDTVHALHCTEVARWPNASETVKGIKQVVPDTPNTAIVEESTAKGDTGYFRDLFWDSYDAAEQGRLAESGYAALFVSWLEHFRYRWTQQVGYGRGFAPGYCPPEIYDEIRDTLTEVERFLIEELHADFDQLAWRRRTWAQKCKHDWNIFNEMYPAVPEDAFTSSGSPCFDVPLIREIERNLPDPSLVGALVDEDPHETMVPMRPKKVQL